MAAKVTGFNFEVIHRWAVNVFLGFFGPISNIDNIFLQYPVPGDYIAKKMHLTLQECIGLTHAAVRTLVGDFGGGF
jgi:hypothetical protein